MKKNNLLLIFVLTIMFVPVVSFANHNQVITHRDNNVEKEKISGSDEKDFEFQRKEENNENQDKKDEGEKERNQEREDWDKNHASSTEEINDEDHDCEEGENEEICEDNNKDEEDSNHERKSEERRSQVAEAVKEMLKVADRTGGLGEKIKVIAQEQKENFDKAEEVVKESSKRGKFMRFFVGPDYSKIKEMEEYANQYSEKLEEMKQTTEKIVAQDVVNTLDNQIKKLEQAKAELEKEIRDQKGGFSLFGWLNRLLSK